MVQWLGGSRFTTLILCISFFLYFSIIIFLSVYPVITPVLRIDNQQNFKIMKISILFKSFSSLFYIIRYIL